MAPPVPPPHAVGGGAVVRRWGGCVGAADGAGRFAVQRGDGGGMSGEGRRAGGLPRGVGQRRWRSPRRARRLLTVGRAGRVAGAAGSLPRRRGWRGRRSPFGLRPCALRARYLLAGGRGAAGLRARPGMSEEMPGARAGSPADGWRRPHCVALFFLLLSFVLFGRGLVGVVPAECFHYGPPSGGPPRPLRAAAAPPCARAACARPPSGGGSPHPW
ncbi:hypothetical protein I4F81_009921 [Pyropia yezoensis]|uniref:Uncharacterized protein n=1 Tax=Pyropia yezoensis TaxID=2788 RepID=A0ACC3CBT0_PYRYE|nr:hypothetical protein I4F81_009921 [Neopyropia yezoensis]